MGHLIGGVAVGLAVAVVAAFARRRGRSVRRRRVPFSRNPETMEAWEYAGDRDPGPDELHTRRGNALREVDVVLTDVGPSKIAVLREVRAVTGLSLAKATALLDQAPVAIRESLTPTDAEELKAQLAAAGAVVEIR